MCAVAGVGASETPSVTVYKCALVCHWRTYVCAVNYLGNNTSGTMHIAQSSSSSSSSSSGGPAPCLNHLTSAHALQQYASAFLFQRLEEACMSTHTHTHIHIHIHRLKRNDKHCTCLVLPGASGSAGPRTEICQARPVCMCVCVCVCVYTCVFMHICMNMLTMLVCLPHDKEPYGTYMNIIHI